MLYPLNEESTLQRACLCRVGLDGMLLGVTGDVTILGDDAARAETPCWQWFGPEAMTPLLRAVDRARRTGEASRVRGVLPNQHAATVDVYAVSTRADQDTTAEFICLAITDTAISQAVLQQWTDEQGLVAVGRAALRATNDIANILAGIVTLGGANAHPGISQDAMRQCLQEIVQEAVRGTTLISRVIAAAGDEGADAEHRTVPLLHALAAAMGGRPPRGADDGVRCIWRQQPGEPLASVFAPSPKLQHVWHLLLDAVLESLHLPAGATSAVPVPWVLEWTATTTREYVTVRLTRVARGPVVVVPEAAGGSGQFALARMKAVELGGVLSFADGVLTLTLPAVPAALLTADDGAELPEGVARRGDAYVVEWNVPKARPLTSIIPASERIEQARDLIGRRILFIDDEAIYRKAFTQILESYDVEVVEAGTAEEALRTLESDTDFDLILLDRQLKGTMRGEDIWQAIAHRHPALARRVLFNTGDTEGANAQFYRFLKAQDIPLVRKPAQHDDVVGAMRTLIVRRDATDGRRTRDRTLARTLDDSRRVGDRASNGDGAPEENASRTAITSGTAQHDAPDDDGDFPMAI